MRWLLVSGGGRFGMVPGRAFDDLRLTPGLITVLGLLATYGDKHGWAEPSLAEMAHRRSVSPQAISKAIAKLVDMGYVEKRVQFTVGGKYAGGQKPNLYRVLMDPELPPDHDSQVEPPSTPRVDPPSTSEVDPPSTSEVDPIEADQRNRPEEQNQRASAFDTFWRAYPRSEDKPAARLAFTAALKKASAQTIISEAVRYRNDPNRELQFTPYPAKWLKGERWNSAPLPTRRLTGHTNGYRPEAIITDRTGQSGVLSLEDL